MALVAGQTVLEGALALRLCGEPGAGWKVFGEPLPTALFEQRGSGRLRRRSDVVSWACRWPNPAPASRAND